MKASLNPDTQNLPVAIGHLVLRASVGLARKSPKCIFPRRLRPRFAATIVQFVCAPLLAIGLFTRVNALLLTATLGVAISQNILADRDPQLAIVYVLVMVSMAFMGGGKFSLDGLCFHGASK